MRVIAISKLREYWETHAETKFPLSEWYIRVCNANWKSFADMRNDFNRLWTKLNGSPEFDNRRNAAWLKWQQRSPLARRAMLSAPSLVGRDGERLNPYFFIADFPEPQPIFLSGIDKGLLLCIPQGAVGG